MLQARRPGCHGAGCAERQFAAIVPDHARAKNEDIRADLATAAALFEQQQTFAKPMAVLMTLVDLYSCGVRQVANLMLARAPSDNAR